jgi:hypothetical protein
MRLLLPAVIATSGLISSVLDSKFGDRYSWRGARIARREEGVYWA